MRKSEYDMQAYVNQCLNQQHGLDSPEGSAALVQANKPEVDGTDLQKEQFLAKYEDKQSVIAENQKKLPFHPKSTVPNIKTLNPKKT
ncbi:hypothetical protein I4U23_028310 [Adineta vaga]|nr:hypothetical protein I4U23_028310 [Adineta vaga]